MTCANGIALLLAAAFLAGCPASDEDLPGIRPPIKYFGLVLNQGDESIGSYEIDPETNDWTSTGPDINTLPGPIMMRLSQDRSLAFVLTDNNGMPRITVYKVDRNTGALNQVYRRGTGVSPMDVAVTPDKQFVYVVNYNPASVYIYERDTATNVLTEIDVVSINANARRVVVSANGQFLYVNHGNSSVPSGGVSAYEINQDTGALDFRLSDNMTGLTTMGIATDPNTSKLCRLDTNLVTGILGSHRLVCRVISSNGAPFGGEFSDAPAYPYHLSFDRSGRYIYVVNKTSETLVAYARGATGALIPDSVNEQDTQTDPSWVSVDPVRDFVYVANTGSDSVSVYTMNPENGAVGHEIDISVGNQPIVVEVVASQ